MERSVSHLLKYAKEEDYSFDNVNLAAVLDTAITQMRGKLEANHVSVSRNYIGGPTIRADADKLRQVFTNVIDNAIDAMESNAGERRLEIGIRALQPGAATVVIRDNGMRNSRRPDNQNFQSLLYHQKQRHRAGHGYCQESHGRP